MQALIELMIWTTIQVLLFRMSNAQHPGYRLVCMSVRSVRKDIWNLRFFQAASDTTRLTFSKKSPYSLLLLSLSEIRLFLCHRVQELFNTLRLSLTKNVVLFEIAKKFKTHSSAEVSFAHAGCERFLLTAHRTTLFESHTCERRPIKVFEPNNYVLSTFKAAHYVITFSLLPR